MQHLVRVWRLRRHVRLPQGEARFNVLAASVCLLAAVFLALSFHSRPAGAGLNNAARAAASTAPLAVAQTSSDLPANVSADELKKRVQGAVHSSRIALELHVSMLELGRQRMQKLPDYTATFTRQERLEGGDLLDMQTMEMKLRHAPLSIYLKWVEGGEEGRELLFIDGQNDNRMLVKLGGGKKLLPAVKVDPEGSLAMSEARHPVTSVGLLQLCDKMLVYRRRDLQTRSGLRWQLLPDQRFDNQPCHCFVVEYESREVEPLYRKSIAWINTDLSVPVCLKTYGWPAEGVATDNPQDLDNATLLEHYAYTNLQLETRLSDADFDKGNAEYRFRR